MADGETAVMQQPILPIRNPYLRGSWNLALWLVSHDQNIGILYCKMWGAGDARASDKYGGLEKETERKEDK